MASMGGNGFHRGGEGEGGDRQNAPGKGKLFQCHFCERTFRRKYELTRYEQTHNPPRMSFQCQQCTHMYTAQSNLQHHIKEAHESRPT